MNNAEPHLEVTLENCADEPIHIPGFIQPHGAMLIFNAELALVAWSANVSEVLGIVPPDGFVLTGLDVSAEWQRLVAEVRDEIVSGNAAPSYIETKIAEVTFDGIAHVTRSRLQKPFETGL